MGRGMGRSLRCHQSPPPVSEVMASFLHLDLPLNHPWTVCDIWTEAVIVVVPADGTGGCCKRVVEQSCRDPWQ